MQFTVFYKSTFFFLYSGGPLNLFHATKMNEEVMLLQHGFNNMMAANGHVVKWFVKNR